MFRKESPAFRSIAGLVVVLLSPIIFIGVPTRVAFNEWFIEWEYSKEDFPKDRWGLPDEYRKKLAKIGLRAVLSDEGMEEFKRARLPDGRRAFNVREIRHMEDVKRVLDVFFPLVYASLVLTALIFLLVRDAGFIGKTLIASSLFSTGLALFALLFSLIDYDKAFELFHIILFDPYSWRFRSTDTLLRIYPMKFWFDGTLFVIGGALFLNLISLGTGIFLLKRRR